MIKKNINLVMLELTISSIALFILYKIILIKLGADILGLWALILSAVSLSRLTELGFTATSIKYISKYIAIGKQEKVIDIFSTSIISISVIIGIISIIVYIFLINFIDLIIDIQYLNLAISIIPISILSFWFTSTTGVILSTFEGYQKYNIKSFIMIFSNLFYLTIVMFLIDDYGLKGIAYAQLFQVSLVFFLSFFYIKKLMGICSIFNIRWKLDIFKEIFSYGINFQVISIVTFLYIPLINLVLTKLGSLEMTGYFEIANKIVEKTRVIIASGNRVLVPIFSTVNENGNKEEIRNLYLKSFEIVFTISIIALSLIAILSGFISNLLIGNLNEVFINFIYLLILANFGSLIATPAYNVLLGIGNIIILRNLHIVLSLSVLMIGGSLAYFVDPIYIVVYYSIALLCAGIYLLWWINKYFEITEFNIITGQNIFLLVIIIITISSIITKEYVYHIIIYILCVFLNYKGLLNLIKKGKK